MRKIIVSEMVSIDGFFAGPNGELDWHVVNAEFNDAYAIPMLKEADMLLFGRVTYDLMESYWPTPDAVKNDPVVAEKMNNMAKIVFSKTDRKLAWNNSKLMADIVPDEIRKIKEASGKDILIFGSGTIASALTQLQLIDEYRFIVNPIVLGKGKPLFTGFQDKIKMKLLDTKTFNSGNVLLRYGPAR